MPLGHVDVRTDRSVLVRALTHRGGQLFTHATQATGDAGINQLIPHAHDHAAQERRVLDVVELKASSFKPEHTGQLSSAINCTPIAVELKASAKLCAELILQGFTFAFGQRLCACHLRQLNPAHVALQDRV